MEERESTIAPRINLSFEVLLENIQNQFDKIGDIRYNPQYKLSDVLLSGFAMFSLKDPSLLAFENRATRDVNLKSVYKLNHIII